MKSLSYLFIVSLLLSTSPLIAMERGSEEWENPIGSARKKQKITDNDQARKAPQALEGVPGINLLTSDLWQRFFCKFCSSYNIERGVFFQSNSDFRQLVLNGLRHLPFPTESFLRRYKSDLTNLRSLHLPNNQEIGDDFLANFLSLEHLSLVQNRKISNAGICQLPGLRSLDLSHNFKIEDISPFTNLTTLNLSHNIKIEYISQSTNLTNLNLSHNGKTPATVLLFLTNLRTLNLENNSRVTDEILIGVPDLISLDLSSNSKITDLDFTNLRSLKLGCNRKIYDTALSLLTTLEDLDLSCNRMITNDGVSHLVNLTSLDLSNNPKISHIPSSFTNLTSLNLSSIWRAHGMSWEPSEYHPVIPNKCLSPLTNLRFLNLYGNRRITSEALSQLTNLTYLDVRNTAGFNTTKITHLTKLTSLLLEGGGMANANSVCYEDHDFLSFTNLTFLTLVKTNTLTSGALRPLTSLTFLTLVEMKNFTNDALLTLTNLRNLSIKDCNKITPKGYSHIKYLRVKIR